MDILSLTAVELAKAIREGKTTSVEATQAVLDKIAAGEDTYHCYVTVEREKALQQAAEVQKKIEAGELTGPLAGVPFAIKDNMCTEGTLTTCSSKILENFVPTFSAEAVLNLEKAGAVILGKTNMDEFAMGSTTETSYYGVTKNPRNPEHVPGGSSGGSAAAVAAQECFAAYRRFHSTARILLRCRRHEAHLWNCIPLRTDCLWFLSGPDRTADEGRDGLCHRTGGHHLP